MLVDFLYACRLAYLLWICLSPCGFAYLLADLLLDLPLLLHTCSYSCNDDGIYHLAARCRNKTKILGNLAYFLVFQSNENFCIAAAARKPHL